MSTGELVLHFEVKEGRLPETRVVAQALLDWVAVIERAAKAIDPVDQIEIETAGVNHGSVRFPQIIKVLERGAQNIDAAWAQYPQLKRLAAASALTIVGAVSGSVATHVLEPSVQTVELSEADKNLLKNMRDSIKESQDVKLATNRFYRGLERDSAIEGVGVAESWDAKPEIIIPRTQFAERGGLWGHQVAVIDDDSNGRIREDTWDVVLLSAPFIGKPMTWRFMRDGLPFSAKMNDAVFLQAIREGRIPITLQEGVVMKMNIQYRERLNGQVWEPVSRSWKVTKVLSPLPRPGTP